MSRNGQVSTDDEAQQRLVALLYANIGFFRLYGDSANTPIRAVPIGHPFVLMGLSRLLPYRVLTRRLEATVLHEGVNAFTIGRPIIHKASERDYSTAFQFYTIEPDEYRRATALTPPDDFFRGYFSQI